MIEHQLNMCRLPPPSPTHTHTHTPPPLPTLHANVRPRSFKTKKKKKQRRTSKQKKKSTNKAYIIMSFCISDFKKRTPPPPPQKKKTPTTTTTSENKTEKKTDIVLGCLYLFISFFGQHIRKTRRPFSSFLQVSMVKRYSKTHSIVEGHRVTIYLNEQFLIRKRSPYSPSISLITAQHLDQV